MPCELPWPAENPSWDEFRANMPVVGQWAYFDHAAVAPLTAAAQTAVTDWALDVAANGAANWPRWRERVEELRRLGSQLLGADPREITIIHNTTEGINIVAEGYPWREGDNLVTLESEFPSNRFPWLNLASRGVETRLVPTENERVDLNRVADACDERTRILSVSWVGYATGWRNDVKTLTEIAHKRGALLFLDAIQGLGVFPLDVREVPIDFLAADGHKWLLGPEGAGLFYLRSEHLDRLRPVGVGWNSVRQAGRFDDPVFDIKQSAARYEGGSYNMPGVAGLAASLNWLLNRFGVQRVSDRLLEVSDSLCEYLAQAGAEIISCRDGERRSGIVAFQWPGADPQTVKQRCREQGIILNCRAGRLRASPHAYNNEQEIARLVAAIVNPG